MEKGSLLYADNLAPAISQGQAETNEKNKKHSPTFAANNP